MYKLLMYTQKHTYIYIYIYIYNMHLVIHTCVYIYIYVYIHVSIYRDMHINTSTERTHRKSKIYLRRPRLLIIRRIVAVTAFIVEIGAQL